MPALRLEIAAGAIAVRKIGVVAAAALSAPAGGIVAATFARSLYAAIGRRWICIGSRGLGSGPLNVLCALPDAPDWQANDVAPGVAVRVSADALHLGSGLVLSLAGARLWRPAAPPVWSLASLRHGLQALDRLTGSFPEDGLGLFVRPHAAPSTPLARRAAPILDQFRGQLCRLLAADEVPEPDWSGQAIELLGLGPGLTPSGDDFLAGAMIALEVLGRGDLRDLLWAGLEPVAGSRTVAVSRAHLAAAAQGMGSAALHDGLNAVLAGNDATLPPALSGIDAIGHCSGWDALAGAVTVLRGWSITAAGMARPSVA